MSDLFNASVKGDIAKVKKILSVYSVLVNDVDQNGCTALLYSVLKNFVECSEALIEAGADVDAVDSVGNTPLMVASSKNHKECALLLVKSGAKVNGVNKAGRTALSYADESNNDEIVDLLVDNGAEMYTIAEDGETPIWFKPKTPALKKRVAEEQEKWQRQFYKKEAEANARDKYFKEHPSVLGVFRRLVDVCNLRRFDDPLYSNSLELIKDAELRGVVEQILQASADRKIWEDSSKTALRTRLRNQFDASQIEVQNYVTLHPRAYVQPGQEPDDELKDLIKKRDEARRRFVSALKDELGEGHVAQVDARYEYLNRFTNLFNDLKVPVKDSEIDKMDGIPAVFPSLDSFIDKLENWISVNMRSPVNDTNALVVAYNDALKDIVTATDALIGKDVPNKPMTESEESLFPAVDRLEKALDEEAIFWTRDPIDTYPEIRSDVQELCLTLSSYSFMVRESIQKWRVDYAYMDKTRNTLLVWVGGAPKCEKFHAIHDEVKAAKKVVRRLCREHEDMMEDGVGDEEMEIMKKQMAVASLKLQNLKKSLSEERKRLAVICRKHFPELCLTQPALKLQLEDLKDIEMGLLLNDRYLTDYSDRVLLSCSNRSMLYKTKFCDKPVALRKYLITQSSSAAFEIRKEARDLAKLASSPYIVPIEGIFLDEDITVCLQLPFYQYGNLETFMKKYGSVIPSSSVCAIMRRVCKGLSHLHSKDIVHCDLKLENILIDDNCSPLISDIDISIPNHDRRVNSAVVWNRGHVDYMAPENLPPVSVPMSLASDSYAVGICLLKALGKSVVRNGDNGVHNGMHIVPHCEEEGLEEFLKQILNPEPMLRLTAHQIVDHEYFPYHEEIDDALVFDSIRASVQEMDANDSSVEKGQSTSEGNDDRREGIPLPGLSETAGSKKLEKMKCNLCSQVLSTIDGVICAGGNHFTCDECFGAHVQAETLKSISQRRWMEIRSKFDGTKYTIRRTAEAIRALFPEVRVDEELDEDPWSELKSCEKWFTVTDFFPNRQCIVCPSHSLCRSSPFSDEDVIRHISVEECVNFRLSRDELVEWKFTCSSEDAVVRERDRIAGMSDIDEAAEEARSHIIGHIMPLLCPRCGVEYKDYAGSLATVCSSCQCGFCSLCCADCGEDATSHVLHCDYNSTGCLFASEDDFKDAQVIRQDRMSQEYICSLSDELRESLGYVEEEANGDEPPSYRKLTEVIEL